MAKSPDNSESYRFSLPCCRRLALHNGLYARYTRRLKETSTPSIDQLQGTAYKPHIVPVVLRSLAQGGYAFLPTPIAYAGECASERFIEFFTANIRNKNTRLAYARAVYQFFDWCDGRGLGLQDLKPTHIAGYIQRHLGAKPTVKQHLAAIRMLFDYLVTGGVLPMNPAASVRGPKVCRETW